MFGRGREWTATSNPALPSIDRKQLKQHEPFWGKNKTNTIRQSIVSSRPELGLPAGMNKNEIFFSKKT